MTPFRGRFAHLLADEISPAETGKHKAEEDWQEWLRRHFADVCTAPFAKRHIDLWEWEEALEAGVRPKAFFAIWPRGGGKSTTVELICARVCHREVRHFMLIVSETQEQANKRIGAISELLGQLGIERAVNQYGTSQGWKTDLLRTNSGFNVAGYGLKEGVRGIKLGKYRPDIIVLDDIDGLMDTPKTTAKKIQTITDTLINAGSEDCAYLYVQNRIIEFGVMSQLRDGTAEFLLDREPISEEPAVVGLQVEPEPQANGPNLYRVVGGEPTWAGQSLRSCEQYINASGLKSFLREMQHEVEGGQGLFFNTNKLGTVRPEDVPELTKVCVAWDFAGTEGGGDFTAGVLMGRDAAGRYYILAVFHNQWGTDNVNKVVELACKHYKPTYKNLILRIPQDPAVAGKRAADADKTRFKDYSPVIKPVAGKKAVRASDFSEQVNLGNVYLVEQDLPEIFADYVDNLKWQYWHQIFKSELRKFREDEEHDFDDQVDAGSDAFAEIAIKRTIEVLKW